MFKKIGWVLFPVLILSVACFGAVKKEVEQIVLKTQQDKVSYMIGFQTGQNLKKQGIEVDLKLLKRGLIDGLSGDKPLLSDAELKEVIMTLQKDVLTRLSEKNKKDGEAFLANNKTKPGVVTLPSGLQYKVLTAGTGPTPKADDTVTVNYQGTLIDGTEFDSSYKRGTPAKFGVSQVIPGWTEALKLMKVGAQWQLFIPANLAYGEQGAGRVIGPNTVLIFKVELLSIEPK